jgi:polyamine oxidase
VLRRAVGLDAGAGPSVDFDPPLPLWKSDAIGGFKMGHYCKLFLEFDEKFWDSESFIYASEPSKQWPVFQSMRATYGEQYPESGSKEVVSNFEDKNVLVGTTTGEECVRISSLSDDAVIAEAMEILTTIFGPNTPQPKAHYVTRWPVDEWTYGSYPFWLPGTLSWKSRTLEYPVDQVFFTGDATNPRYPAYTHGAYLGGVHTAAMVLACLGKDPTFPMDPMEAEWEAFGVSCPEQEYDEDAVRDSYYTEPFPTDQSEGEFYYYYYKYYASWTTP